MVSVPVLLRTRSRAVLVANRDKVQNVKEIVEHYGS